LAEGRTFSSALFLLERFVYLLQQGAHFWEVRLEVTRFPEVQCCGSELPPLQIELTKQ